MAADDAARECFDGGAKWIWSGEGMERPRPDPGPFRVRYFRRTFDAPAGARLVAHVSADSRYKLWCNGARVSRGPAKGDVPHQFYETVDVSGHLRSGPNVLAAQVEYYGDVWCTYAQGGAPVAQMTACPGFVLDGVLRGPAGEAIERLHTDRRWRVLDDRAYRHEIEAVYSHCIGLMEVFSAAHYPWGFTLPEYDDAEWPAARELPRAMTRHADADNYMPHRLLPRMIAPMAESAPRRFRAAFRSAGAADPAAFSAMLSGGAPVTIPAGSEAVVLIDAGELTTGYPRLRVTGGAGATVRLRYAEALMDEAMGKSRRDDLDFGDVRGYADTVRPDGPERTWEPFFWRTFRFLGLTVATAGEPLTIHGLDYVFTAYPFEALAELETSDRDGGAIWDASWRTARLCAHETYEDCPYYEQLQYAGDTQVQAMVSYCVAGDASLGRQWLYHFDWSRTPEGLTRSRYPSRVPQTIPLFSLHWVMGIHDYWMHTGDRATVSELLPGVRAVLDYFDRRLNDDGTVGWMPGWMYADWCPEWMGLAGEQRGAPPGAARGRSAIVSFMAVEALEAGAALAEAAGADGGELSRRAEALRRAAHAAYYDPGRGLYRDTPELDLASRYTNARAILAGLPCDRADLAGRVGGGEGLCSLTYFSSYFAWRALAAAGRDDLLIGLLGPWRDMLAEGLTTWKEEPADKRSDCHAWGAWPMAVFCRDVLGVRPAKPGYAAVAVEPRPMGLRFARGRVPLTRLSGREPVRFVEVDWRIESGRLLLRARAPEGVPCRAMLPGGPSATSAGGDEVVLEAEI